jgi:hypothetical protein
MAKARWVKPELLGDVVYRALSGEAKLHHASFKGIRDQPERTFTAAGAQSFITRALARMPQPLEVSAQRYQRIGCGAAEPKSARSGV